MTTQIDKEACREAYNQVRDDNTETSWAAFKYEGSTIVPAGVGSNYQDFKELCTGELGARCSVIQVFSDRDAAARFCCITSCSAALGPVLMACSLKLKVTGRLDRTGPGLGGSNRND
ncbi:coactosin-like protein isoform X2 [Xiphophorus couchianus]|uniref:coactosin-like protein isoform X2 n=1 Tax=Xiphophorus couchianus TaxID=32473 RepID=UPI0010171153|nr:coactosin-like protein isoform X2 [Xiphophorus couchianus]